MRVHTEKMTTTLGIGEALAELDRAAPTAPFLALGQTVFWDEPMKAGVAIASKASAKPRKLIAGIHDTDYFAKLPSGEHKPGSFASVPHNDTKTKGLWSAAAEFSALFGSETVITKETLQAAGLRVGKLLQNRPDLMDEATEAWGWRGIVSLDEDPPITAEVPLKALFPELKSTLQWAIDTSLQSVCDPQRLLARERAERLMRLVDECYDEHISLAEFYRRLVGHLYSFSAGEPIELEATRTTELLKFNRKTCVQPRFDLLNLFVSPESAAAACDSYNEAIRGSEIYDLSRFGSGAIPFDLVIPGVGRGTIRVARRAIVISTPDPQFISLKAPIRHVQDFAEAVCSRFGDDCVVIGKAVSLIGMLAREYVFIFHEGASPYVAYSRKMHGLLSEKGHELKMNPILRVRLNAWDALQECNTWIRLPEPFQRPFGTEELTAPSFAGRWKDVTGEQAELLRKLGELKRPLDLIKFLETKAGGSWHCLASEYGNLHEQLEKLEVSVNGLKVIRRACYGELRALKAARVQAEQAMGEHFRERIFEKQPTEQDFERREQLRQAVEETIHQISAKRAQIKALMKQQSDLVGTEEVRRVHERRRAIELEAELKRLRLVRQAVITSKGLVKAAQRPSAWWFPLLCPDGGWFRSATARAECYLEPLQP